MRRPTLLAVLAGLVVALAIPIPAQAVQTGDTVDYDLVFPVDGPTRFSDTYYAARSHGIHHATDLMADKGVPVVAAASGTVRFVNWSSNPEDLNPERCCSLVIRHDDGWQSWYIHLDNDTPGTDDGQRWGIVDGLLPGSRVEAGDLVGWVGDSGNAEDTPPHLHFELRAPNGVVVNPYRALLAAQGRSGVPIDVYRVGHRGDGVIELQERLRRLGFDPGPADGVFGPLTAAAIAEFQTRFELAIDGIAGPQTLETITRLLDEFEVNLRLGDRGAAVARLQEMLITLGIDPGPVDGIFGGLTLRAVRSFQEASGLVVDGIVGPNTKGVLGL